MARFYAIHEANAALPDVERILVALRDQRGELVRLRDRVLELERADAPAEAGSATHAGTPDDPDEAEGRTTVEGAPGPRSRAAELKRLRLRMQGLVDQMQAGVARLVESEIQLRDIPSGLIDFPALAAGRPIWLCWRLGEGEVEYWHAHDEGFSARRPLTDLHLGLPTQ